MSERIRCISEEQFTAMTKRVGGGVVGTHTRRVPMTGNVPNETDNAVRNPLMARNKVGAPVPIRGESVDILIGAGRGEAYNHEAGLSRQLRSKEMGRSPKAGSNPAPSPYRSKGAGWRNPDAPTFHLTLAITGQMVSGKNAMQTTRTGQHYPLKRFTNWRSQAHVEILEQVSRLGTRIPTITVPVRLLVEYFPGDARTRDVDGMLGALLHILVYSKVLKDDGLVHDVIWRRQVMNRNFPKVRMEIETKETR